MDAPSTTTSPWIRRLYGLRWPLSLALLVTMVTVFQLGWGTVLDFSRKIDGLGGDEQMAELSQPKVFDSRYDIWFDREDEGIVEYKKIEDKFAAEDFVLVAFEEKDEPWGAFSRPALETLARLTDDFERVPNVRLVRSLVSNPWIRWGEIEAGEEGLLISDLFEDEVASYSDDQILERMIAVIGAERAADLAGEDTVRALLGPDANFDDYIGEPRLIGAVVSEDGRTTALQLQVLRPKVMPERLDEVFGDDEKLKYISKSIYANETAKAALSGVDHFLRIERGLAERTPEYAELEAWIAAMPEGEEKRYLAGFLENPNVNFIIGPDGEPVRKYFEYDAVGDGFVDQTNPANVVHAPEGFAPEAKSDYDFHTAGLPYFERNFITVGMADMRYVGYMFGVVALVMILLFRRIMGMVVPLMVVFSSVAGMLGIVWMSGDLLNNLTATTPNMVTAIGIADAVHLVAAYLWLRPRYDDKRALIQEVLSRNALPVFLTSITTAIGFFSLLVSNIIPVTMMGYTAGIGALLAYLISMTLVPALLSLIPVRKKLQQDTEAVRDHHWGIRLADFVLHWKRPIAVVSVILIAMSALGLSRLDIDTDFRTAFPDDNPVMRDFHWIEARLGGASDLEMVFSTPPFAEDDATIAQREERIAQLTTARMEGAETGTQLSEAEADELARLEREHLAYERGRIGVLSDFLEELDRFETRLETEMEDPDSPLKILTKIESPLDVLRKIHQVQNENRAAFYRLPTEDDVHPDAREPRLVYDEITEESELIPAQNASTLVSQYYLQYENGAKPAENLSTQISADRRYYRMQGRVSQASSVEQKECFARINEIARDEFPMLAGTTQEVRSGNAYSRLVLSGKTLLFASMSQKFATGFLRSMGLALLLITVLIGVIYRSAVIGLLSLIPNVLPIVLPFGVFGLLGVPVDGPAALVSSVALGVCVDDTIHFFTKFTRSRAAGLDIAEALRVTYRQVGGAITFTTIIIVLGFGVLSMSDFSPNRLMGQLMILMVTLAWVADFVLTPALLAMLPDRQASSVPSAAPLREAVQH